METVIAKVQKYTLLALAAMLIVVMILSLVRLGVLSGQKIVWGPTKTPIPST